MFTEIHCQGGWDNGRLCAIHTLEQLITEHCDHLKMKIRRCDEEEVDQEEAQQILVHDSWLDFRWIGERSGAVEVF